MQIDQKTLARLLSMNDERLALLINRIARESGITPETLGAHPENIASIRAALGSATEEDLKRLNALYAAYRKEHGR